MSQLLDKLNYDLLLSLIKPSDLNKLRLNNKNNQNDKVIVYFIKSFNTIIQECAEIIEYYNEKIYNIIKKFYNNFPPEYVIKSELFTEENLGKLSKTQNYLNVREEQHKLIFNYLKDLVSNFSAVYAKLQNLLLSRSTPIDRKLTDEELLTLAQTYLDILKIYREYDAYNQHNRQIIEK